MTFPAQECHVCVGLVFSVACFSIVVFVYRGYSELTEQPVNDRLMSLCIIHGGA